MTLRQEFIAAAMLGETSFAALCREYDISRKTGYKWLERARNGETLDDHSRAPYTVGNKTPPEKEALILGCREDHPAWGPRKLERYLENHGHTDLPCKSTIANILKRESYIDPDESEKHTPWQRFQRSSPNSLWQMDFKGDFEMLDGNRCYPLTALDDYSRYSLCLEARPNLQYAGFKPVFSKLLEEYGRPWELLCDHGKPWSDSKGGITAFDLWMMRLDILPIHGRPLHPQTQGKEERFHRTLKSELLKYRPMLDLDDAQKAFNEWRWEYNNERPHEALKLACPASLYRASERKLPSVIIEPEYDFGEKLRKVNCKGYVNVSRKQYYLSEALIGLLLAIRETDDGIVTLSYGSFDVAKIDLTTHELISRHISRRRNV